MLVPQTASRLLCPSPYVVLSRDDATGERDLSLTIFPFGLYSTAPTYDRNSMLNNLSHCLGLAGDGDPTAEVLAGLAPGVDTF
jgi:hypothetical protein